MSTESNKGVKMPLLAGLTQTRESLAKTVVVPNMAPMNEKPTSAWDMQLKKIGPYQIVKVLGFGGVGTVFEALDTQINRQVALKVLNRKWINDDVAKERFLREARLSAMVKSPHVAMIHAVGDDDGVPYLAMELLSGFSLEELIHQIKLTMPQILRLAREMAKGLAAAHSHNLIHRDIKPGNIWLETLPDPSGSDKKVYRVKILDFGLARLQEQTDGLTRHGIVVGTPLYMSPEQINGSKLDPRSDLFSLGVVLYQLCTGKLPFHGESVADVWDAILRLNPVNAREINPEVPQKFARLIDRLLNKSRDNRPLDAVNVVRLVEIIESEEERRVIKQVPRAAVQKNIPNSTPPQAAGASGEIQPLIKLLLIASLVMNLVMMVGMGVLIYLLLTRH